MKINIKQLIIFLFLSISIFDIFAIKIDFNIIYFYLLFIGISYIMYQNFNIFINNSELEKFIIIFILYLIFNHFFISLDKDFSFGYTVSYSLWLLILFIFSKVKIVDKEYFLKAFKHLHLFLFFFLLLSCVASIITLESRMLSLTSILNIGGFNPNLVSIYLILFLLLSIILYHEKKIKHLLFNFSIVIFIICFFYARSRGAIFSFFAAAIILFYVKNIYISKIRLTFVIFTFFLVVSMFFVNIFNIQFDNSQINKIIYSLNALVGFKIDNNFDVSAGRFDMYNFAFVIIQNIQLFLFGTGIEAYQSLYITFEDFTTTQLAKNHLTLHSVPLQHIVGLGVIGLFLFFYFFKIILKLNSKIEDRVIRSTIKYMVLFLFINSFFSDVLINRVLLFYLSIIVIFYSNINFVTLQRK